MKVLCLGLAQIIIHKRAETDIDIAMEYYLLQQEGVEKKFIIELEKSFSNLSIAPFYQVRYFGIRCLPLKKFPFMIHYKVNEEKNQVHVFAVIHTSLNPEKNWIKNK